MSHAVARFRTALYQTARPLVIIVAALAAACSAGCNGSGHGSYTKEHLNEAQEKMSMLKSGTEWQMAHQQFLAGDLDKSLKTVDRSIAMNPKVTKSHVLRGRILLEKSRLEEARGEFLKAAELDPTFVEAHYYLGIVYERVGQYEDALGCYHKAMDLDSANAQYVVAGADMLVAQNRLDDAEQLLTQRRQYLEYNAAIRQTMGRISQLRGQHDRAAQFFSEALLLAPGDQSITEDLVTAQIACNQFADAESMLGKLLDKEANKSRRDLKAMRAKCLVSLNRPVDARTILQDLTSDKDGSADLRAWTDLGNVCALLHDSGGLRTATQHVLAMAPNRCEGYMLRAMFCRQDNRLDDALTATDQAIARSGNDVSPYIFKAIILQDLGRISEARTTLVKSQQIDPQNQQVAAFIGAIDNGTVTSHPDASR